MILDINPTLRIADDAYLFIHPSERDRYKRVAENVDLLNHHIADVVSTIASW